MKTLKDIITERLHINKKTQIIKDIDYDTADYVINDVNELMKINKEIFTEKMLNAIFDIVDDYPIYVWKFDVSNKIKVNEIEQIITKHRKYNNITAEQLKSNKTDYISDKNCISTISKFKNYMEIFIISTNGQNVGYLILN